MARHNAYAVKYRMPGKEEEMCFVSAANKAEAYEKAFYEVIPEKEGEMPYSAWVYSVTYQNGNYKCFNTCEGLAY